VIAQILLEGLVAQLEAESSAGICVNRGLQVQCLKRHHMFRWFRAILVGHHEMKLIVDEPVVGHVKNGAIFQEQLRHVGSLVTIGKDGSRVHLRNIVCGTR